MRGRFFKTASEKMDTKYQKVLSYLTGGSGSISEENDKLLKEFINDRTTKFIKRHGADNWMVQTPSREQLGDEFIQYKDTLNSLEKTYGRKLNDNDKSSLSSFIEENAKYDTSDFIGRPKSSQTLAAEFDKVMSNKFTKYKDTLDTLKTTYGRQLDSTDKKRLSSFIDDKQLSSPTSSPIELASEFDNVMSNKLKKYKDTLNSLETTYGRKLDDNDKQALSSFIDDKQLSSPTSSSEELASEFDPILSDKNKIVPISLITDI